MKIVKNLFIGLVIVFGVLIAVSFFLPTTWLVARSVEISAPAEKIYPFISNFKKWGEWSGFDYQDPNIQYSYEGPEEGLGAKRSWVSSQGDGSQTITKADPQTGVEFDLVMANGFAMKGEILLKSQDGKTFVAWIDKGKCGSNPMHRWMCQFMDMMMGKTFEQSLVKLKEKSEAN